MTHTASLALPIAELREALNRAMDTLEQNCGQEAEVQYDYFWSIDSDRAYDMKRKPTSEDIDVGQVSDSWEFLQRGKADAEARTPHDLLWAGEILTALGHQISASPREDD